MGAVSQMQMNDAWKQWAGQVVGGRFPLRQYLGSSDHSVVYLTERFEPRAQEAVIKLIPANEETAEGQLSRWATIARLSHPHLLRLFETGRCELGGAKLLYVVMEYAEESLSQILPERPLRPHEVRDMLPPILSALEYLHGNRFVHARLKPSNILAAGDQLRISSDGLRSIGEAVHSQGAGMYDAPETGNEPLSPAADVWSLGLTIVEGLTQRLPESAVQTEPTIPPTLPPPFLDITRNCLRLYPQRRWKLAEISSALQGGSLPKQDAGQGVFPKWRYALLLLVIVAVLAVLLIGPKLTKRGTPVQPINARTPQPSAPPPQSLRVIAKPESKPSKPDAGKGTASARKEPVAPAGSLSPTESPPIGAPKAAGVPGTVVHQVVPNVPASARNTITGKVRVWVRVAVDSSGNVTDTTLDRPGPSKYFARLAQQAAAGWKFTPAQNEAQNVRSEWVLRFEFGRESTQVFPAPAAGPAGKR